MIVKLPELLLSRSAQARSKTWIKRLDSVDTTKSDGYAFRGQFTKFEATVEVPDGTFFLSYVEDVRGSGRLDGREIILYQATDGELVKVETWELDESDGWALKVRDEIAKLISPPPSIEQDLLAERARLAARIDEIDQALAGMQTVTAGPGATE